MCVSGSVERYAVTQPEIYNPGEQSFLPIHNWCMKTHRQFSDVMRRIAMPLFDFDIMVDWSGGARRRGGRSDTIWIAHGPTIADAPLADSPFSRTEAVRLIHSLLLRE